MDIFKRPGSKFWWYRFTVDGVCHRGSTKRPLNDAKGARRVLSQAYDRALSLEQFGDRPEITLSDAFDRAIDRVAGNASTKRSYELVKRRVLGLDTFGERPGWHRIPGDKPLHKLSDGDLEDMVRSRKKAGNSNNTINVDLRVLKAVVLGCKRRFRVPDLSFDMQESFEKTRFLTAEEEAAVLTKLDAHGHSPAYRKARQLCVFLVDTGVRLSEAMSLKWPQVNLTEGLIETYRAKTKTLSMVPVSNRVKLILKANHNSPQPFHEMSRAVRVLRKAIDEVCNGDSQLSAQRGSATIHSLRDTYASRLASKGMSLHKVSKLLGHSTPTMTRKYAHIEPLDVAAEARRMLDE